MNQEEQRKLAINCGGVFTSGWYDVNKIEFYESHLAAYTAEVEARERERCAQECDMEASTSTLNDNKDYDEGRQMGAIFCAKRIRK